jgi:hypothetical protein
MHKKEQENMQQKRLVCGVIGAICVKLIISVLF